MLGAKGGEALPSRFVPVASPKAAAPLGAARRRPRQPPDAAVGESDPRNAFGKRGASHAMFG